MAMISWDMESWFVYFDHSEGERCPLRYNIENYTKDNGFFRAEIMWIKLSSAVSIPGENPKMLRSTLEESRIWALRDVMPPE